MIICDSIAVKVLQENKILRGIGNALCYDTLNGSSELKWKLSGKIHGIDYNKESGKILIYGDKEFMILCYSEDKFSLFCKNGISDWISNGKLLQNNRFGLLTGHLVIMEFLINDSTIERKIKNKISCQDKSTLYCSLIHGDTIENLLVFGGTAWEVIIWQPFYNTIIGRLNGNNGVILSVDLNLKYNLLTITSDDRSIKFYDIFLEKSDSNQISKCTFKENYIQGYAHAARVFQGKIVEYAENPIAISVGEDSSVCIWDRFGKLILKRQNHHFGATIWSLDYDYKSKTIWTAGSDGNCFSLSIKNLFTDNLQKIPKILESEVVLENIDKIRFVDSQHIIGITNKNHILYRTMTTDWKYVNIIQNNFKPTVLEVFNEFIAIGGFKRLVILKFEDLKDNFRILFDNEIVDGVIRSICLISANAVLVCNEAGSAKIINMVDYASCSFIMPKCKEPWITTALQINNFLILSNRVGSLFLYSIEKGAFILRSHLKRVNGSLGVTTMKFIKNYSNVILFKTYGHDNTIKLIKLHKLKKTIEIVGRLPCPIAWVQKVFIHNRMEFLVGFNSIEFLIWEKDHNFLAEINCGGGHRYWDCKIDFSKNKFQIIFIKKGKLCFAENILITLTENLLNIPRYRWHNKSCNSIKSLKNFIISAGEDNIVKYFDYENDILALNHEVFTHISSIKTISVQITENNKYLIFTAGGRAQICVSKLDLLNNYVEETYNFMLRSTDFNRKYIKNLQEIDFDPETRIMSLDVIRKDSQEYDIYSGCSDGYIRKFNYKNDVIEFTDELFYNKCILHVKIILNSILCSTSTDGTIQFWDILKFNENSKSIFEIKPHENGINSFDVICNENYVYIITGGDDQNVVFTKLEITNNFHFKIAAREIFNYLHTAQVTGVKFSSNLDFFYSTSIDQTVCKIELKNYTLVKKMRSNVPDIKGLEIMDLPSKDNINCILVFGCGIETFNF